MYFRRVQVIGRSFAVALTHVSNAATPPALAAQNLGAASGGPAEGSLVVLCLGRWHACAARHAAARFNDQIFAGPAHISKLCVD